MTQTEYSFKESRVFTLVNNFGEVVEEKFNVNIDIEGLTFDEEKELRHTVQTLCIGHIPVSERRSEFNGF